MITECSRDILWQKQKADLVNQLMFLVPRRKPDKDKAVEPSMQQQVATTLGKSTEDKVTDIRNWIAWLCAPQEVLGRHPICPFAATATVIIQDSFLRNVAPWSGVDVAIFIVEDDLTLKDLQNRCKTLNAYYPEYIFLDDHKDDPSYINGIQTNNGSYNLILVQSKNKLLSAREVLHKSDYYAYWSEDFYQKIVEESKWK